MQVVTAVGANILDLSHHARILWIVDVILVLNDLVILVKDLKSLLGAIIGANNAKLPRMLLRCLHLLRLIDKVDRLVVGPTMMGRCVVVSLSAQKRGSDLLEAWELPAVQIPVGSNDGKCLVHVSKDYGEDPRRRHYDLAQLNEGVGIEHEDVLLLDGEEVVPSSRVLDDVRVTNLDTFQSPQPIMQDVVNVNLVDEASCKLVT